MKIKFSEEVQKEFDREAEERRQKAIAYNKRVDTISLIVLALVIITIVVLIFL